MDEAKPLDFKVIGEPLNKLLIAVGNKLSREWPAKYWNVTGARRRSPGRKGGVAVYNLVMAKDVIHISEAEAATTNVATLLAHVRAGAEVVIENDTRPVAVLRSAEPHPGRLLSESIALAEAHGSTVTLDGDFGRDLEEIINSHREPLNPPAWD